MTELQIGGEWAPTASSSEVKTERQVLGKGWCQLCEMLSQAPTKPCILQEWRHRAQRRTASCSQKVSASPPCITHVAPLAVPPGLLQAWWLSSELFVLPSVMFLQAATDAPAGFCNSCGQEAKKRCLARLLVKLTEKGIRPWRMLTASWSWLL